VVADAKAAQEKADAEAKAKVDAEAAKTAPWKVPERFAKADEIIALAAMPESPLKEDILRRMVKLLEMNEQKDIIIQKPNRLSVLKGHLEDPAGMVSKAVQDQAKADNLTIADLEAKFLNFHFQGGKVLISFGDKLVQNKETGNGHSGRQTGTKPESMGLFLLGTEEFASAHAVAKKFDIKYEGMPNSKAVLTEAQRLDSGAQYVDGKPVLKADGSYTRDGNSDKRYHPFFFTFTETGTRVKDGKSQPIFTLTKNERAVDENGFLVKTT